MQLIKLWHPKSKGKEPIRVPPGDVGLKLSQGWTRVDPDAILDTETLDSKVPLEDEPSKEILDDSAHIYTREELEPMKIKELRAIGKPLGVNDTDKKELLEEILQVQKELAS